MRPFLFLFSLLSDDAARQMIKIKSRLRKTVKAAEENAHNAEMYGDLLCPFA
jgi:hypothetical protein